MTSTNNSAVSSNAAAVPSNAVPAPSNPAPARPVPRWMQTNALSALRGMTHGSLTLRHPDNTEETIGTPGDPRSIHCRIHVNSPEFYRKIVLHGDIGFGEAYVEGHWDTPDLARVIAWAILNTHKCPVLSPAQRWRQIGLNLLRLANRLGHHLRRNTPSNSRKNISAHYDLGNDFYRLFLDPTMAYSSALFVHPDDDLHTAQHAKYDRLCQQLRLKPGDHLLEIGTGWGGLALHAAKNHGCRVTTVTISRRQHEHATELIRRHNLSHLVEIRLQDYRHITGTFDKIVSVEMLEAVGDRFLETFFTQCHRLLRPDGLLALQYITTGDRNWPVLRDGVDFIQKHIFPGSLLLSIARVNQALNRTGDLFLHDLHDLGDSYARTLRHWFHAFNNNLDAARALGHNDTFIRRWNYYLQYCEAAFATRNITVVQATYTRLNNLNLSETAPLGN